MSSNSGTSKLEEVADAYLGIDCAAPLSQELIGSITALCERVEDAGEHCVAVVHLASSTPSTDRADGWPGEVGVHLVNHWERALRRLERLNAITIAVAEGSCGGPALEVLLATDYRIAADDLRLLQPWHSGALWPSMVLYRLANQLGVARARPLALFAREVPAAKAEQVGLVDEVASDLVASTQERVAALRGAAGPELAIRRRLLLDATATTFEDALGAHLSACDRSLIKARQAASDTVPMVLGGSVHTVAG